MNVVDVGGRIMREVGVRGRCRAVGIALRVFHVDVMKVSLAMPVDVAEVSWLARRWLVSSRDGMRGQSSHRDGREVVVGAMLLLLVSGVSQSDPWSLLQKA